MYCFQMVWVDQDESGLADIKDLEAKLKVYLIYESHCNIIGKYLCVARKDIII